MAARGGAAPRRGAKSELRRVPGPSAAPPLDRLVHERVRLGILSALAVNQGLSFADLKKLLETTDGNLSVHARKLEEAGLVRSKRSIEGRAPRTVYSISAAGRRALNEYLEHMEALIRTVRGQ